MFLQLTLIEITYKYVANNRILCLRPTIEQLLIPYLNTKSTKIRISHSLLFRIKFKFLMKIVVCSLKYDSNGPKEIAVSFIHSNLVENKV